MVEARKPTREQLGQNRQREEEFERAAAELRPQWAPSTVGDAMADFQAAAAAEQAEEAEQAERLSVLPVEPSIVVEDELVRAAQLTAEPARAPVKRREAYPETYVGFAPTKPGQEDEPARASATSYGVQSAFAPGASVNAVPGAFAPSGFPALDDESSKSRLSQLGGGSVSGLAKRHGKLIAIVAGACVLLGVLVALFSGSDDAPVAAPQATPAPVQPPVAVTPVPSVEPAAKLNARPEQARPEPTRSAVPAARAVPVARKPAPVVRAPVKAPVKAAAKPVVKAKAPIKAAPVKAAPVKAAPKAPLKATKPAAKTPVKGKPAQPVKRERSPIDVLNPWGS